MIFLATIPFELILIPLGIKAPGIARGLRLLRLMRLLRLAKGAQFLKKYETAEWLNPSVFRLFILMLGVGLTSHWIACGWYLIWQVKEFVGFEKYTNSLYWTLTTLTTVGYGDISPNLKNNLEKFYTMFVMMIGVGVYGYVIGNISTLLTNIDIAKAQKTETLKKINAFLKYKNIPNEISVKIRNYYDYLWENKLGFDELDIVAALPPSLKTEHLLLI